MTTREIVVAGHWYTSLNKRGHLRFGHQLSSYQIPALLFTLILSKWLSIEAHFCPFPVIGKNVIELSWAHDGSAQGQLCCPHRCHANPPRLRRNVEANGGGEWVEVRWVVWGLEELARGIQESWTTRWWAHVLRCKGGHKVRKTPWGCAKRMSLSISKLLKCSW